MKPGRLNAVAAASTETGVGVPLTFGLLTSLASAGLLALNSGDRECAPQERVHD